MATARLPLRLRLGVAAITVAAIAAVGGATAVVQVGAGALQVGGGFVSSASSSPATQWAGFEVRNRSALPLTLGSVQPRVAENVEVLSARVIEPSGSHLLQSSSPLPPDLHAAIAHSHRIDGFVLAPHSGARYEVVVEFRPRTEGTQAVLARTAITYSVLGLDHGAISDGVYCVRATGAGGCPPY